MRIGYASGVFDLFHVGHLNLVRRARLDCDFLFVGVCSDEVALELTGRTPVTSYEERLAIVRSVRFVDAAIGKLHSDSRLMWQQLHFDVIFKGQARDTSSQGADLQRIFAGHPVEVVYLPYTASVASRLVHRDGLTDLKAAAMPGTQGRGTNI
jgi:glycerol-3-phosphate cytidylyltransferase